MMDPTRTILAIVAPLVPPAYAIRRDDRTSAEVARDRLLWCQHHDPVTRPSQKRMFSAFKDAGYVWKPSWPRTVTSAKQYRNGKPVLTTRSRIDSMRFGRIYR